MPGSVLSSLHGNKPVKHHMQFQLLGGWSGNTVFERRENEKLL
jgi:hypothetical protein